MICNTERKLWGNYSEKQEITNMTLLIDGLKMIYTWRYNTYILFHGFTYNTREYLATSNEQNVREYYIYKTIE